MEFITKLEQKPVSFRQAASGGLDGQTITVQGAVHALRELGGITFLTLRMRTGPSVCVRPGAGAGGLCEECAVRITGTVRPEERAPAAGSWRRNPLKFCPARPSPCPSPCPSGSWI